MSETRGSDCVCDLTSRSASVLGPGKYFGAVGSERHFDNFTLSKVTHVRACALPSHAHELAFVSLLLKGQYVSRTRTSVMEFRPCQAVFHPEHFEHRDCIGPEGGAFFCVQMDIGAIIDPDERRVNDESDIVPIADVNAQASLINLFTAALAGRDEFHCDAILHEFAARLFVRPSRMGGRPPPWLQRLLERFADEPLERAALSELAVDAGVHPMTLARLFRAHVGCSIGEYRRRARAIGAVRDVINADGGLSDLSQACGYSDQSHMTREFRKVFDATPAQIRRAG